MNRDQKLLSEAYQKVLEDYTRFRGSDKLQRITPGNAEYVTTDRQRDPEWEKRWEQDKDRLKNKWVDIGSGYSDLVNLINKNEQKAKLEFGIYNLRNLKPGDKKSQEFILSLAKKDFHTHYELFKLINPDKILKGYRNYVDPDLQKADDERDAQQQVQNTQQRSTSSKNMSDTIKKLKQAGFKQGKSYKDEQGVMVVPMSKTIGSLLGGRQDKTVPVNPDGTIFKGEDVDNWLTTYGKHFAQGKKSLF